MGFCGTKIVDDLTSVTENSNGTLNFPDGTVMSVQPDGSVATRPNGTAGDYEKVTISDDGKFYEFSPLGTVKYLFSRR